MIKKLHKTGYIKVGSLVEYAEKFVPIEYFDIGFVYRIERVYYPDGSTWNRVRVYWSKRKKREWCWDKFLKILSKGDE